MEFKKKRAHSCVELMIILVFVMIVMFISTPLLTHSSKKANNVYGEFRCFTMFDKTTNQYKLYQQFRYNSKILSSPKPVSQCTFDRPTGVSLYNITVIGGGGGGSAPYVDNQLSISQINNYNAKFKSLSLNEWTKISEINPIAKLDNTQTNLKIKIKNALVSLNNGYYKLYKLTSYGEIIPNSQVEVNEYQFVSKSKNIPFYIAKGGEQGEIISKNGNLTFNPNNQLIIKQCKNYSLNKNYDEITDEYDYCVGIGGFGGNGEDDIYYNLGMRNLQNYLKYFNKISAAPGNNGLNCNEIEKITSSKFKNKTCSQNYLESISNESVRKNFYNFLYDISNKESSISYKTIKESTGYDGQYSRFKLNEAVDILAQGGLGGVSNLTNGMKSVYNDSNDQSQTTDRTNFAFYYFYSGENGSGDLTYSYNNSKIPQGGNCNLIYATLNQDSCNGADSDLIGAGGAGGGIGFKLSSNYLSNYIVTQFRNVDKSQNIRYIHNSYNISSDDSLNEELSYEGTNKNIYYGRGGSGGGGAIIITW